MGGRGAPAKPLQKQAPAAPAAIAAINVQVRGLPPQERAALNRWLKSGETSRRLYHDFSIPANRWKLLQTHWLPKDGRIRLRRILSFTLTTASLNPRHVPDRVHVRLVATGHKTGFRPSSKTTFLAASGLTYRVTSSSRTRGGGYTIYAEQR